METTDKKMAALHRILKPIELELQAFRFKSLSSSTKMCYNKIFNCLQKRTNLDDTLTLIETIIKTKSKNTFFMRRAACEYAILKQIEDETQNFYRRQGRADPVEILCFLTNIEVLRNKFVALQSLRGDCQLIGRRARQSKRKSLSGLPPDWREQIYLKCANGKYAQAIAVTTLTGCRPSELQKGVLLKIVENNGEQWLSIRVNGAKVSDENGQPFRELLYSLRDPTFITAILVFEIKRSCLATSVSIASPKAFTMAITRAGKALWPRHPEALTAYSFRHAIASDLKSTKSKVDVAACPGHASTKTQKTYGQKQQSRSMRKLVPDIVNISRKIRVLENAFTEDAFCIQKIVNDADFGV